MSKIMDKLEAMDNPSDVEVKAALDEHFLELHKQGHGVVDTPAPTYALERYVPAYPHDCLWCTFLGHFRVWGALSGYKDGRVRYVDWYVCVNVRDNRVCCIQRKGREAWEYASMTAWYTPDCRQYDLHPRYEHILLEAERQGRLPTKFVGATRKPSLNHFSF